MKLIEVIRALASCTNANLGLKLTLEQDYGSKKVYVAFERRKLCTNLFFLQIKKQLLNIQLCLQAESAAKPVQFCLEKVTKLPKLHIEEIAKPTSNLTKSQSIQVAPNFLKKLLISAPNASSSVRHCNIYKRKLIFFS